MYAEGEELPHSFWEHHEHVEDPLDKLVNGTHVFHDGHGPGVIAEVDQANRRGRPYLVNFKSGESHRYTKSSARAKLTPCATEQAGGAQSVNGHADSFGGLQQAGAGSVQKPSTAAQREHDVLDDVKALENHAAKIRERVLAERAHLHSQRLQAQPLPLPPAPPPASFNMRQRPVRRGKFIDEPASLDHQNPVPYSSEAAVLHSSVHHMEAHGDEDTWEGAWVCGADVPQAHTHTGTTHACSRAWLHNCIRTAIPSTGKSMLHDAPAHDLTRDLRPESQNPRPATQGMRPSTLGFRVMLRVCGLWSLVSGLWSLVSGFGV